MKAAFFKTLRRLVYTLAVHASFVFASTMLLLLGTVIAEMPSANLNLLSTFLLSVFVLIPWLLVILIPLTLLSAFCSGVIYLVGGFFHEKIALAAAVVVGAIVMYIATGGPYVEDMKFHLSMPWKVALVTTYIASWITVRRFFPTLL